MAPPVEWIVVENPEIFIGPPKPANCVAGMTSHTWTVNIEEGHIGLHTDECRLCNDGAEEIMPEELTGEFKATLEFFHEKYGDDVNWWWEIHPINPKEKQ